MCGIAGYLDFKKQTSEDIIHKMVQTLHHRGPDDNGAEHHDSSSALIGMGMARLSIIDLTLSGHQPMHHKMFSVIYNGEIYNYKEIRVKLEKLGHHFRSNSDTEVILHAYEYWGTEFVHQFIGMFVIAIYDREKQQFLIFRDRAGVKPIYYYWSKGLFLFASELKSFYVHPDFVKSICKNALALFFDLGYIPAPHTIFDNTYKIEAGKFLVIDLKVKKLSIYTYWDLNTHYRKAKFEFCYEEAKERLNDLLISAYNYRMVADVPVGIFLSGGYDSTSVAAILQMNRTEKLKTFTIGFEQGNNEAPYARSIARFLGTQHTELVCTTKEAQEIIPELPYNFDEPFADSSAIPTILVSRLARKQVTVSLSADAGDEVFAGYLDYVMLIKAMKQLNYVPSTLKSVSGLLLHILSGIVCESSPALKHKLHSIAHAINANRFIQAKELFRYSKSLPEFYAESLFLENSKKLPTKFDFNFSGYANEIETILAIDYQMYLQDDILTKVDRATMSVSLEGREPLLDHRIIEFAAQLPVDYKLSSTTGKHILKDIVHKYVPKELLDRPKAGFSLPIYYWLRDDLIYLVDEFLCEKAIAESGFLNAKFVAKLVGLFKMNKLYYKTIIWKLLMFQMWYFRWMK